VKDNGITSPLHKENVGKIVFTSKNIATGEYKEADFLPSYRLTPKANLYMTAFMKQSLTNYLHSMAPDLPDTELTKLGNYHFSFYVDNKVIYQEPLHIGAVYPELKNTETILSKPVDSAALGGLVECIHVVPFHEKWRRQCVNNREASV
jgi:hypothetical protein